MPGAVVRKEFIARSAISVAVSTIARPWRSAHLAHLHATASFASGDKETRIDFLRFFADLAHLPDSWRQWVGGLLTVAAAFSVPVFVKGEIAVVYICLVLLAGGVLISFWEGKAKAKPARGKRRG